MGLKSKPLEKVRADVPMAEEAQARVNFNVPKSVHSAWKVAAAKEGRPLAALVTDAVEKYLKETANTH